MITKSWLMDLFEGTSNFRFYSNRIFRRNLPDEPFRLWQEALPKLCRSFPGASPSKHFTSQFFKYNSSCCHGQYFWSESSKVKQQWKICHKFQGSIMQDLPHLTQFVHNRHQNRHIALYNHYCGIEDLKSDTTLLSTSEIWCCTRQTTLLAS